MNPQPGWYKQNASDINIRYWDGTQWTEHVQSTQGQSFPVFAPPAVTPAPQQFAPAPGNFPGQYYPAQPVAQKSSKKPLVIVIIVVAVLILLVGIIGGGALLVRSVGFSPDPNFPTGGETTEPGTPVVPEDPTTDEPTTPTTPTDPDAGYTPDSDPNSISVAEQKYVDALIQQHPEFTDADPSDILVVSYGYCESLSDGESVGSLLQRSIDAGIPGESASYLIGYSVGALCPTYSDKVLEFANGN